MKGKDEGKKQINFQRAAVAGTDMVVVNAMCFFTYQKSFKHLYIFSVIDSNVIFLKHPNYLLTMFCDNVLRNRLLILAL